MRLNGLLTKAIAWAFLALCAVHAGSASAVETVVYYHNDALGSPVAATGAQGEVLWREAYSPYGDRLRKEDGGSNSLWYTAKPHEADFDLTYSGARWYMPATGRFTGIDPVGFQEEHLHSFNRYIYANNNPYKYVDPDGEFPILPILLVMGLEALNLGLEVHDTVTNTCGDCVKSSGAIFSGGFGLGAGKALSTGIAKSVGKEIGILRDAARGKGNFGLGSGTKAEADRLGQAWVGDGYKVASDGKTLVSNDGFRQYRPPSYKPNLDKVQANFEQRFPGQQSTRWQSNGHLDITD